MNPNVRIINNSLQMVSFQQVRMGWIPGMSLNPESKDEILTLDKAGIIYINTDEKFADDFAKWMVAVKKIPSKLFFTEKGFVMFVNAIADENIMKSNLKRKLEWKEAMKKAWDAACKYESIRRQTRKEYVKKHWMQIVFSSLINTLKGGVKYGKHTSIN